MPKIRRRSPIPAGTLALAFSSGAGVLGAMWVSAATAENVPPWAFWIGMVAALFVSLALVFGGVVAARFLAGETVQDWQVVRAASRFRCNRPNGWLFLQPEPLRLRVQTHGHELVIREIGFSLVRRGRWRTTRTPLKAFSRTDVQVLSDQLVPEGQRSAPASVRVPPDSARHLDLFALLSLERDWEQALTPQDLLSVIIETRDHGVNEEMIAVPWDLVWGAAECEAVTLEGERSAFPQIKIHSPTGGIVPLRVDILGSVWPPDSRVQVFVFSADGQWYPKNAVVEGTTWQVPQCQIGTEPAKAFTYRLLAVSGGPYVAQPVRTLPAGGIVSEQVQVRRQ